MSVKYANIASEIGFSSVRRQAIIWTNVAILWIRPKGTYFSDILFQIQKFTLRRIHLKCRQRTNGHFVSALMC